MKTDSERRVVMRGIARLTPDMFRHSKAIDFTPDIRSPHLTLDDPDLRKAVAFARAVGTHLTTRWGRGDPEAWGYTSTDPDDSYVRLRPLRTYFSPRHAITTVLHELVHWAGTQQPGYHEMDVLVDHLVRPESINHEEVVAEVGATLLYRRLGFVDQGKYPRGNIYAAAYALMGAQWNRKHAMQSARHLWRQAQCRVDWLLARAR